MSEKRDFDKEAATWDDNPVRVALSQAIAEAIIEMVPIRADMEALDYGAGTGLVTLCLQPHVKSIAAADSAPGMLARLQEKIDECGLSDTQTLLLDLERDTLPGLRFDLIVSAMTMHHIGDAAGMVGKLARMLRPGGSLAVADLEPDEGQFHPDPAGVMHHGFAPSEMEGFFTSAGLADVRSERVYTVTRDTRDGSLRSFPIFLAVGRLAASR